ncbi:ubiquitin-conjugating enzyme/RWD-like protein [Scheffersomyces xylosifermentans]|uniref:ubiquitin-conjugating enzyme/RWD-like protein n=1 Tax=Scheffersomyces xylosifermentans TaxID=1304137 RepID=UPI00315C80DD
MAGGRHPFFKRLLKEYKTLSTSSLPGITLVKNDDDLTEFIFRIQVNNHQLYKDSDLFHLSIVITNDYPVDSPRVQFIIYDEIDLTSDSKEKSSPPKPEGVPKIPIHPHIYSNGHICLNLLGDDWTPACSIESVLLSIQSMLDTNEKNERPPDDSSYVKRAPLNPKSTRFVYHDDTV